MTATAKKTERHLNVSQPVNGVYAIAITQSKEKTGYYVKQIDADFGLAFSFTNLKRTKRKAPPASTRSTSMSAATIIRANASDTSVTATRSRAVTLPRSRPLSEPIASKSPAPQLRSPSLNPLRSCVPLTILEPRPSPDGVPSAGPSQGEPMNANRIGRRIQVALFVLGFLCSLASCNPTLIALNVSWSLFLLTTE
jgi:hypothetical protein